MTLRPSRPAGARVLAWLLGIILLTAVLPPAAAWALNRHRVTQTVTRAEAVARSLDSRRHDLVAMVEQLGVAVACGPGRMPDREPSGLWVNRAMQTPGLLGESLPADGWGRCYLVNIEALRPGAEDLPVWVISAGPNGFIDTHPAATQVQGDDLGVRLQ